MYFVTASAPLLRDVYSLQTFEGNMKRVLMKDEGNDLVAIVRSGRMEVHNASWTMREREGAERAM